MSFRDSDRRIRLGVVGDVHGEQRKLSRALEAIADLDVDAVVLVGDLISHAWARDHGLGPRARETFDAEIDTTLSLVAQLGVPATWVPGNHDLPGTHLLPDRLGARTDAPRPTWHQHARDLDRCAGELAGLRLYGIGGAGPARFGFPYEWDEAEIDALEVPQVDLLLVHTPPARSGLDLTASGFSVGSEAIRRHCKRARALVCGHIHEAAGVCLVDGCLCLNAGALGEPFGRLQIAWIDFETVEGRPGVTATHRDLESGRARKLRAVNGQSVET